MVKRYRANDGGIAATVLPTKTKAECAFAALDLHRGKRLPTLAEAAAAKGVSPTYLKLASKATPEQREAILAGKRRLVALAKPSNNISSTELLAIGRQLGVEPLWGVIVELLDEGTTTATAT